MTIDDLAIRSAPGLQGERVDHRAADCKLVDPLMENFRLSGKVT
jgi:hypothetical protein